MMQYVPYFRTLSSRAYMPVWERLAKTDSLPITQYRLYISFSFLSHQSFSPYNLISRKP